MNSDEKLNSKSEAGDGKKQFKKCNFKRLGEVKIGER